MRLEFHPGIERDLRGIIAYYNKESLWAADRFLAEFRDVLTGIKENPKHHHLVDSSRRRCNLDRFPYHLIYEEREGVVHVLVLRHHRRRPDYGMRRKMQ